ncbi:hypothetical protein GLOTRDRAFT_131563 [Gloeophyllum trabeum ATCC 11539]|uniref:DH domain-containing protein n=1 Tax=Gloeophyllum trabeum (strain ATCC 11539 / FP-39264 / Madison 617) TaxID=670483 RepID=S7RGE5_GLOTA|nr:uncharacterized protein GLOTRDRAFT_131563 [Gloeophyllum trabeum ATCC 11539]EPQ53295.1 hypothetical protein GLOTRDRAFT_131563 [Gloeophyllum trabeum ATCC 11539]
MSLMKGKSTRSKSRSPAPPSPAFNEQRQPRFFPPSYYAAAAGLQGHPEHSLPREYGTQDTSAQGAQIAVDYPYDSSSDSGTRGFTGTGNRRSSISSKKSFQSSSSGNSDRSHRRQTQLESLEAQLLPSLRDTIDRMTHPAAPASPRPASVVSPRTPGTPARNHHPPAERADVRSPSVPKTPQNISSPSMTPRVPRTPRDGAVSSGLTPKSTHRSILKSTPDLRSLALNSPVTPASPFKGTAETPTTKSLRSARSIVTRTRQTVDPVFSSASPHSIGNLGPLRDALAEAENPSAQASEPGSRSRGLPSSAVDSPTRQRSSSRMYVGALNSHLPRRLAEPPLPTDKRRLNLIGEKTTVVSSSSSEMEYDADCRNSRVLIVANANVMPSSSESEGEKSSSSKKSNGASRLPVFSARKAAWSSRKQADDVSRSPRRLPIGLGIEIGNVRRSDDRMAQDKGNSEWYSRQAQDHTEDEDDLSVYEDDPEEHRRDDGVTDDDEELRRKRQAELVNMVDGLTSAGTLAGLGNAMLQSASASGTSGSWHGGIALSGSEGFAPPLGHSISSDEEGLRETIMNKLDDSGDDNVSNSDYSDEEEPPSCDHTAGSLVEEERPPWSTPRSNRPGTQPVHDDASGRPAGLVRTNTVKPSRPLRPLSMPTAPKRPARPEEPVYRPVEQEPRGLSSPGASGRAGGPGSTTPKHSPRPSAYRHSVAASSPSGRYSGFVAKEDPTITPEGIHTRSRTASNMGQELTEARRNSRREHEFRHVSTEITKSDSYSSSVGEDHRWREQSNGFSHGAEALFHRLQHVRNQSRSESGRPRSASTGHRSSACNVRIQSSARVETRQSADQADVSKVDFYRPGDEVDIRREVILSDLRNSEEAFLDLVRPIVTFFVQPLRNHSSRSWVQGVPTEVAPFFDWFEDIVNLHTQFLGILRSLEESRSNGLQRMCQTILRFVPKLEIYQPYLAQVESAVSLIDRMAHDRGNDFGVFIRMQRKHAGLSTSSFKKTIFKPRERLHTYIGDFQRLLQATPKGHSDYLPAFSLYNSIQMIIQVMLEVKAREDEYCQVKALLAQIDGIPSGTSLVKRERRLLAHGSLVVVQRHDINSCGDIGVRPPDDLSVNHITADAGAKPPRDASLRQSRLGNAVLEWDRRRSRSRSVDSAASSMVSFGSRDSISSGLTAPVSSSGSYSESHTLFSPSPAKARNSGDQEKKDMAYSKDSGEARHNKLEGSDTVLALVFTDLLVLAKTAGDRNLLDPPGTVNHWLLLPDVGVTRILDVVNPTDDNGNITLDLLTVDVKQLETGEISDDTSVLTLCLALPEKQYSIDRQKRWLSSLRQSSRHTLRSFSFPSHSGKYLGHGSSVDLETDTRQAVLSILASGLPIPKSPSIQLQEFPSLQGVSLDNVEREGRGWWALRYQQIFREMQRMDLSSVECGLQHGPPYA